MSSNGTRFDTLLPIFHTGVANDKRARLILDDLMNINKGSAITNIVANTGDGTLHVSQLITSELVDFYSNVKAAKNDAKRQTDLVALVKSLATASTQVQRFGVALVKQLFIIQDSGGLNIRQNQSAWGTATTVTDVGDVADTVSNTSVIATLNWGTLAPPAVVLTPGEIAARAAGKVNFTYKIDRYRMRAIMDDLSALASKKQGTAAAFFGGVSEGFSRDGNNKLVDSKGVEVGRGSANQLGLKETSLCYTTKFQGPAGGTATKSCGEYFDGCLRGTGIKACKEFLTKRGYWGDMAVDIKQMSPVIAVQTLEKFGYRAYKNSSGVVEFETVDDWLKRLTEADMLGVNGATDADAIRKNSQLVGYMAAVVAKVNGNPSILNKDLTNKVNTQHPKLAVYGIKAKSFVPTSTTALLYRLSNAVAVNSMRNSILFGLSNVGTVFLQTGGDMVREIEAAEDATEMWNSSMFRRTFKSIQSALSSAGKKIQDDDRQAILKLVSDLEDSERKLFTTMKFASKYVRLLELFGDEDSQKVLNLTDLKKFVNARNKYHLKTTKRTNGLVQILLKLSEASDGSDRTLVPVPSV